MTAMVTLQDVRKSFGDLTVLDGVSFAVDKGKVTALIGRSGSGKSTALRCIDRLETIDGGEITVCDHKVSDPEIDLGEHLATLKSRHYRRNVLGIIHADVVGRRRVDSVADRRRGTWLRGGRLLVGFGLQEHRDDER